MWLSLASMHRQQCLLSTLDKYLQMKLRRLRSQTRVLLYGEIYETYFLGRYQLQWAA
jgi:hypothetical protein